jgi:ABC-2 type transport system permease protein
MVESNGTLPDMNLLSPSPTGRQRFSRVVAVARVEVLRLVRDRVAMFLIVLVPAVQILLFGYAVNLDPKNVPIAIAGGDDPSTERAVRIAGETGYFAIVGARLPSGAAKQMVIDRKALVGIELPPPFDGQASVESVNRETEQSGTSHSLTPRVVADASDPAAVRPALRALETGYWRQAATVFSLGSGPTVQVEWLYNPDGRTAWAIVPGLVGVIVMISMLMLGALTLVRERERGTWETLLATPIDALDALVGKLTPYMAIGGFQGAIVVLIAQLLFHLPPATGLWALLIALPFYALAHLILGFAISGLAESQMQAVQGAVFFYLPSMLLSGFMFPFQGMPVWAQSIGEVLPLTHFVRAARGVLLRGEGVALVEHEMWPVALFALAAGALGLVSYRRRIE